MFKLDDSFLQTLGLGSLPVEEKNRLLQHIYETLEMRVGMRLAENMTELQLDEFESYIDRNDEAGALKWLETNFPNYRDVVSEELDKLKAEISTSAPQILASARTGGGTTTPSAMTPPTMTPPTMTPPTAIPSLTNQPSNQPADGYGQSNFGQGPTTPVDASRFASQTPTTTFNTPTQNSQQFMPPNTSQPINNQSTPMPPEPAWPVEQTLTPPLPPMPPTHTGADTEQPYESASGATNPIPEPMPPYQPPITGQDPTTTPAPPTTLSTSADPLNPVQPPEPMPSQPEASSEIEPPVQPWQPAPPKV